jgi:hypothetical protein
VIVTAKALDLLSKAQPRTPLQQPLGGGFVLINSNPQLRRAFLDEVHVRHEPVHERTAEILLLMAASTARPLTVARDCKPPEQTGQKKSSL